MQNVKTKRYEMDMTSGNLFKKIVKFSIPLMLTGILQLLYNAADLIIVGQFSNEPNALGAVGSTSSLINLTVNLFMGLSVGANVVTARTYAAKNEENAAVKEGEISVIENDLRHSNATALIAAGVSAKVVQHR